MGKDVTDAARIADAHRARTEAERTIAAAELPLLREALDVLNGPEAKALTERLLPLVGALGPSNARTMLQHALQFIAEARRAVPQDVARHEHTLI